VRIAGVNIGRVTGVRREPGGTAVVAMAISDAGRPIHADATMKVRPRIFLEGNFFVDVRPGTGAAPELHDGGTVPLAQTATPVQFDQVLSTLNSSTRDQLRTLVEQYGAALDHGGAEAIRRGVPNWTGAFKGAAIVAEASRGTQEHDLSRFIAAQAQVSGALASRRTQLADLVVQFNHTLGALAARQGDVAASVAGLAGTLRAAGPALAEVNRAIELDPKSSKAHVAHGVGNYYLPAALGGGFDLAAKDFRKAIELDAKDSEAWLWLGLALRKASRDADARKEFQKSLELNPARVWTKEQLAKTPGQ